jgi:hypothetical protein
MDFSLADQVYARARVADVASVNLWLGAGVMLEYTLEAAQELLVSGGAARRACGARASPPCALGLTLLLLLPRCRAQERQLEGCRAQLEVAQADHDYVKDQTTTMEVSIARVYNYDIVRRREGKA